MRDNKLPFCVSYALIRRLFWSIIKTFAGQNKKTLVTIKRSLIRIAYCFGSDVYEKRHLCHADGQSAPCVIVCVTMELWEMLFHRIFSKTEICFYNKYINYSQAEYFYDFFLNCMTLLFPRMDFKANANTCLCCQ